MTRVSSYERSCLRIILRMAVLSIVLRKGVLAGKSYSYQVGPASSEMKKNVDGQKIHRDETPPNRIFLQSAAAMVDDGFTGEKCIASGECEVCEYGIGLEGCAFTGRRKKFECFDPYGKTSIIYHSCLRSTNEENALLLKVQIFCLIIGIWAMRSARSQKLASASLFDQRVQNSQRQRGGRSDGASNGTIESDTNLSALI